MVKIFLQEENLGRHQMVRRRSYGLDTGRLDLDHVMLSSKCIVSKFFLLIKRDNMGKNWKTWAKIGKHGQKLHREDAQKDQKTKRGNHTLKTYGNGKGRY